MVRELGSVLGAEHPGHLPRGSVGVEAVHLPQVGRVVVERPVAITGSTGVRSRVSMMGALKTSYRRVMPYFPSLARKVGRKRIHSFSHLGISTNPVSPTSSAQRW